ncbi:MAG: class I SAM-dependent methyltransferase [Pseudomonadota bacterium]
MEVTGWDGERGVKWASNAERLEAMLTPVDEALIEALELKVPSRVADIGCGGGRTSMAVKSAAPGGSEVVGFDISPALIALAQERTGESAEGLQFILADAGTAEAPGRQFDLLVSRFGVMFFEDPPSAFANLLTWLKPGSRFAFAVWAAPKDNPWMMAVKNAVSSVAEWPQPDPDGPGPFRYADGEAFSALLTDAGFADVAIKDWRGELPVGGGLPPKDAATFALTAFSVGEVLDEVDEASREAAFHHLQNAYARWASEGVVRAPARVHIVTGHRP